MKPTVCLSGKKWSRTDCLLLWLSCSDWWWEELHNVVFRRASSGDKRYSRRFFPLPSLIRCDPFQPTTRAPSRSLIQFSYLPPLCRASSSKRSFTWTCRCFWWLEHSPRCAKTSLPIIIWQVFFFYLFIFLKTIGTEFSVCGSQVNTELLSLSLCQSNIQP